MTRSVVACVLSVLACANAFAEDASPPAKVFVDHYVVPRAALTGESEDVAFNYELDDNCRPVDGLKVWVIAAPAHGTLNIIDDDDYTWYSKKSGKVACNRKKNPGIHVRYRSEAGYSGPDTFEVEVTHGSGRTWTTKFNMDVWASAEPPVRPFTMYQTFVRQYVEAWTEPRKSQAISLIDESRKAAEHFLDVWQHGSNREIRALTGPEIGSSAAQTDQTIDTLKESFGALTSSKLRTEAIAFSPTDSPEAFQHPYVQFTYTATGEKWKGSFSFFIVFARYDKEYRVAAFSCFATPPWLQAPGPERSHID